MDIHIEVATEKDYQAVWQLFKMVMEQKEYFPYPPGSPKSLIETHWINSNNYLYKASIHQQIVGAYIIKPNQPGWGDHICNAAYMMDSNHRGLGIGRAMAVHSLEMARSHGFSGMQYNLVVSTNQVAIKLWESIGFKKIGTTPNGFRHHKLGKVDTYIYFKDLE